MARMRFILIWRVRNGRGAVERRVVGILDELEGHVCDFRNEGWHVVVLWTGVDCMIR